MKYFLVLKSLLVVICVAPFLVQLQQIYLQYSNKSTNTAIFYAMDESMELPQITLCPKIPVKGNILAANEKDYLARTFSKEELFHQLTLDQISSGHLNVTEVRTQYFGRCYTFQSRGSYQNASIIDRMRLYVKPNISFVIHIHDEGENLWLTVDFAPFPRQTLDFVHSWGQVGYADIRITKATQTFFRRDKRNCELIQESNLNDCALEYLRSNLQDMRQKNLLNCSSPLIKQFLDNNSSTNCNDETIIKNQVDLLLFLFLRLTDVKVTACLPPCTRNIFDTNIAYFHPQTIIYSNVTEYNMLMIYYSTLEVEHREEMLIYDVPALLSALGGSLGLFLGFSCLGMLMAGLEWLRKRIYPLRKIKLSPSKA